MESNLQRYRFLAGRLPPEDRRRIVVLTGARQVGKTTLARGLYPALRYVNLDAPEDREALAATRTAAWGRDVGAAVLDEAQKEPSLFEKVKHAFDAGSVDFSVLLGSSRLLLLERVRETLAGRAFLYTLWPLMASEIRAPAPEAPSPPLVDALLRAEGRVGTVLAELPPVLLGDDEEPLRASVEHLAAWGGMPGLLGLDDADRRQWLRSYQETFLERDLVDLARIADLGPFRTLMRLAMLRSGQLLSFAELARDAGVAATTARRYLEYLDLTYQVIFLRPYARNLTSTVVKAPKPYWTDLGLLRQGTGQWGPASGALLETLVVTEIHKWVDTTATDARLSFYRTRSGLEVDLLIETPRGVLGVEVKGGKGIGRADQRGLRAVGEALGSAWRGGLVVYRGRELSRLDERLDLWAVPLHRLL